MRKEIEKRNLVLIEKYNNEQNVDMLKKQYYIYNILKEKNCFRMMKMEIAYSLLLDLGYKREELSKIYSDLLKE